MKAGIPLDAVWLPEEAYRAVGPEPAVDMVGLIILVVLAVSLAALAAALALARRAERKQEERRGQEKDTARGTNDWEGKE